jgi:hypothetical protein
MQISRQRGKLPLPPAVSDCGGPGEIISPGGVGGSAPKSIPVCSKIFGITELFSWGKPPSKQLLKQFHVAQPQHLHLSCFHGHIHLRRPILGHSSDASCFCWGSLCSPPPMRADTSWPRRNRWKHEENQTNLKSDFYFVWFLLSSACANTNSHVRL